MKALIHVVRRAEAERDFGAGIRSLAAALRSRPEAAGLAIHTMLRLPQDVFGPRTPYRAALEITGVETRLDAIESLVEGLADRLADVGHPELSTLLVAEEVVFIACERMPVRYQYLMRRSHRFSHDAYLKRYREIHSRFGLETPGIAGYVQLHVDPEASRRLATRAGLGIWDVDSVSELHLESMESFLTEVSKSQVGAEAVADEEVFVDREHSFDFCSAVEWQA